MKYNHNANTELKTRRNNSYTTIQRDEDESRGRHSDQWPASIECYYVMLQNFKYISNQSLYKHSIGIVAKL